MLTKSFYIAENWHEWTNTLQSFHKLLFFAKTALNFVAKLANTRMPLSFFSLKVIESSSC